MLRNEPLGFVRMTNYSDEVQKQLKDSLEVLKSILGSDLLGVYLFDLAVLGGFKNIRSDKRITLAEAPR